MILSVWKPIVEASDATMVTIECAMYGVAKNPKMQVHSQIAMLITKSKSTVHSQIAMLITNSKSTVKPCKICGDVGVPDIITCSRCKTTSEHLVDLFIELGDEIGAEMGDEVGAFGGLKMVGLGDEVGLKRVG
ncbi:hypothetical protein Tco_0312887 [Tanacetum coccineum]